MLQRRSLTRAVLHTTLLVSSIITVVVGALWTFAEYQQFRHEAGELRERYLESKKTVMRQQVESVVERVKYLRDQRVTRTRRVIAERVNEAHRLTTHLYEIYRNEMSTEQLENLIREALRNIRYNDGRGYFFATRFDGVEMLFAVRPELEGKSMLDTRDPNGQYVIRDMLQICRDRGEGYYSYLWSHPNLPGDHHLKISYVKWFEPFRWFIGTGEYLEDTERDIQEEVLAWIDQIRYDKDGYIFAGTWNGVSLSGPARGQQMFHIRDANGKPIVRALIRLARQGSGFVEYVMPKISGQRPAPKISFASGVPEWKWYIGTGLYVDEIESRIAKLKRAEFRNMRFNVVKIIGVLLLAWLISYIPATRAARRLDQVFVSFGEFFTKAASTTATIDVKSLPYREFEPLADSANEMSTLQKQTEAALKASELRYRRLVSNIPGAVYRGRYDGFYRYEYLSRGIEALTGIARESFLSGERSWESIVHPEDVKYVRSSIKESVEQNSPYHVEYRIFNADREVRWISERGKGTFSAENSVLHLNGIMVDVTDEMRLKEAMVQSEKMMSVGGLAAGMAHEINNPLAGILQSADVLASRLTDIHLPANQRAAREADISLDAFASYLQSREIPRLVSFIQTSGTRAAEIVRNMLSFARRDTEHSALHHIPDLLDRCIDIASVDYDLKKNYDFRQIEIHRDYEPHLVQIPCEAGKIQQVFMNVLRNGAEAMAEQFNHRPSRFTLKVTLVSSRQFVEIRIADNGPGMDATTRKRVFEPFFTTKPPDRGTGLGLSVSYFIVKETHRGEMWVESNSDGGSTFVIRLPVRKIDTED